MPSIKKILVANRGEIALRIMRTAREMDIKTVAIYSEADRRALHVRFADEAVFIGPPASSESYLCIDKVLAAARITGADAIHPGYGFLSENEGFAAAVRDAGLTFIGPSSESIALMGDKLTAKAAVAKFNVPLVPGTDGPVSDATEAIAVAALIGYPVLIKASAGGGGKGIRVVEHPDDMAEQMERAKSEAKSAFGDGSIFIEKYIEQPRHIEFQVFGDQQGNVIHLFERECSIQRRHQKVVEEAPSSVLTPGKRKAMGEAAVNVARACGYYNAGTVEFILDHELNFYFLEMNSRLQVEHPVTEQITGLDLVRMQIMVARGDRLPVAQDDLRINGHAIEVRIYAEDPANNFLPDTGNLRTYVRPNGPGIRVDDGFEQGMDVPYYYDPMIAKLVCHAASREAAIARTVRAIDEYQITGVQTTLGFCRFVMTHPAFTSGRFDTRFVQRHFDPASLQAAGHPDEEALAAILAAMQLVEGNAGTGTVANSDPVAISRWKQARS